MNRNGHGASTRAAPTEPERDQDQPGRVDALRQQPLQAAGGDHQPQRQSDQRQILAGLECDVAPRAAEPSRTGQRLLGRIEGGPR